MPNMGTHAPPLIDDNHVEMATGNFTPPMPTASIGTADSGMSDSFGGYGLPKSSDFIGGVQEIGTDACATGQTPYCDIWADPILNQDMQPTSYKDDSQVIVSFGSFTRTFEREGINDGVNDPPYVNQDGTPETLTGGGYNNPGCYELTMRDGTIVDMCNPGIDQNGPYKYAMVSKVTKPDGEIITYSYSRNEIPTGLYDPTVPYGPPEYYEQLIGVTAVSSLGWSVTGQVQPGVSSFTMSDPSKSSAVQIYYNAAPYGTANYTREIQQQGASEVVRERLTRGLFDGGPTGSVHILQDYEARTSWTCQGGADYNDYTEQFEEMSCNEQWFQDFNYSMTETTGGGRTIVATFPAPPDDFLQHSITQGAAMTCYSGTFVPGGSCVQYIDRGGQRWTYSYGSNGITRTDPLGHTRTVNAGADDVFGDHINSFTDELGRTTTYQYDAYGDVTSVIYPEGNHTDYQYDARQNLTQTSVYPKDGSAPIVTTMGYDTTCNNPKTCNKPNWYKDAKGNETDFTYDPRHGGILTMTLPADANGVRPQMRYTYTQLYPQDINGNNGPNPVWRLTSTSTCRSVTDGCEGTADETVTQYAYNDPNLLLTAKTVHAGDNSVTSTESYGYDATGNLTMVDGPRTDVDDRSYTTYDTNRHKIFEIGVDPDGSGPLPRQIVHHIYDGDFNEIQTEYGTGNATDGSDFTVSYFKRMTYDALGHLIKTEVVQP